MINKIFKSRYLISIVQFFTLSIFLLLIYGAIGVTTNDPDFAKVLRNTNLSNLIIWSYWWPLIIVTAIFFGRFWCTICPMELITSLAARIGLKRKPGNILKSGWIITLFYAIILIVGIHTLAIHRIPQYMAIYMLILFFVALIAGLIWEKRTFCTYICPIGHLLGLYSLLSFKKLRVKNIDTCNNCKTKDCISKTNTYKFVGRSCTSELYPAKITDNRNCILCGQCHKSCTKDNIQISSRKIGSDLFSNIKLSWAEIAFFIIVSGFVIYEVLSEWKVSKSYLMTIPDFINNSLEISNDFRGTIKAIVLFVIMPTIFFGIFALAKKLISNRNIKESFTQIIFAILPIAASMHILKAILKTTSRIPYWEYVVSDFTGVETAQKIMDNSIKLDKSFITSLSPIISLVALLLSLGGIVLSFLIIRKQNKTTTLKIITALPAIIYASLFLIVIIAWRF